jgi:hypothetical protein
MFGHTSAAPLRDDPLRGESASPEVALRSAALTSGFEKLLDMPGVISDAESEGAVPPLGTEGLTSDPPSRRRYALRPASADIFFYLISFGLVAIVTIAVFLGTGFLLLVEPARVTLSGGLHNSVPASSGDHPSAGGTLGTIAAQSEVPGSAETAASSVVSVAPPPATDESPLEKNELARNSTALPPIPEVPKNVSGGNVPSSTDKSAEAPTAKPASTAPMQSPAPSGDQRPADGTPGTVAAQSEMPGSAETTASSVASVAPPPVADELPPPEKNELATALPPTSEVPKNPARGTVPSSTEIPTELPAAKPASTAPVQSAATREPAPTSLAAPAAAAPGSHLSAAEISDLLGQGDAHLRMGDFASARLFYERAAVAGDSQAALRLAATFDPNFLSRAGLRNVRGDAAEARLWYNRALNLGAAEAKYRLEGLETKQGR